MSLRARLGLSSETPNSPSPSPRDLVVSQSGDGVDPLLSFVRIIQPIPERERAAFLREALDPLLKQRLRERVDEDFRAEIEARRAFVDKFIHQLRSRYRRELIEEMAGETFDTLAYIFDQWDRSDLHADEFRRYSGQIVAFSFVMYLLDVSEALLDGRGVLPELMAEHLDLDFPQ